MLSHRAGAVDLSHLQRSAPLLLQHDRKQHVGVVTDAELTGDRIRVTAKVSKADKLAQDTWTKVQEGTLRHFSVGFRVFSAVHQRSSGTITITDWMPLEVSLAAGPEDIEAELGRSTGGPMIDVQQEPVTMTEKTIPVIDEGAIKAAVEAEQQRSAEAAAAERDRVAHVFAAAAKAGVSDAARDLIVQRTASIAEADEWLKVSTPPKVAADKQPAQINERSISNNRIPVIDFPDGTPGSGSRTPYNCAVATKVAHGFGSENEKGLAREITQDCVRAGMPEGVMDGDIVLPWSALVQRATPGSTQIAGAGSAETDATKLALGATTVDEDYMAGALIESLRPMSVALQLGPRTMTGLRDDIAIPRISGNTSARWVTNETDKLTKTDVRVGEIKMSPKNVGAYSQYSDKLLMQSSLAIESLIRDDLMTSIALAQDVAAFYGTGSGTNEPQGVDGIVPTGNKINLTPANGSAFTVQQFIDARTKIYSANVRGAATAVTSPALVGKMMSLFQGSAESGILEFSPVSDDTLRAGTLRGYPVYQSNNIKSDLSKGTGTALSEVFLGVWSNMLVGYWGSGVRFRRGYIDDDFIRQQNTVTISTWLDTNFRHPEAFSKVAFVQT